jgi:hypothetical protein
MRRAILTFLMLIGSAACARAQLEISLDANLRWALFPQYAAICSSFHVIHTDKAGQDAETLLRDLKAPMPYMEDDCVLAHRMEAERVTVADLYTHFDQPDRAALGLCNQLKHGGGYEGCEIESRRGAGDILIRRAISKAVCASILRARVGTAAGGGLCISIPGIDGQEERWAPFISAVFFSPDMKPEETAGCYSPGQPPSSDKTSQALAVLFAGDRTVASVSERMVRAGFTCGRKDCSRRNLTLYIQAPAKGRAAQNMAVLDAAPFIEISSTPAGDVTELCLKPQRLYRSENAVSSER